MPNPEADGPRPPVSQLHAIVAARRLRSRVGAAPAHTWVMDADVGWTGDLAQILGAFGGYPQHLLTGEPASAHASEEGYRQFGLRNYLAASEVRKALLVPVRYSQARANPNPNPLRLGPRSDHKPVSKLLTYLLTHKLAHTNPAAASRRPPALVP